METDMLEVQHMLHSRGILISFTGKLSQRLIVEYGEAVKSYLEASDRPKNEIFNIFSLFIEQTQNINNYCATKIEKPQYERIAQSSIVSIGKIDENSYVCSGNLMETKDVVQLKAHLEKIISMDKLELKSLYKETIKQDMDLNSQCGGLGLIDMARKSAEPLQYSFTDHDDVYSFFTLKATV